MKRFYHLFALVSFFIFLGVNLHASPLRGYIVTKNGRQLTGYIGEVYQSDYSSIVVFINDFGSVYHIHAELIKGFVYKNEENYVAYASMPVRNAWHFLRIIEKGKALSLYQAPESQVTVGFIQGSFQVKRYEVSEFWLQFENKKPTRIRKVGYKGKMRRLLRKTAPELSQKIGGEGYKFQDLPGIVREYNHFLSQKRWKI